MIALNTKNQHLILVEVNELDLAVSLRYTTMVAHAGT